MRLIALIVVTLTLAGLSLSAGRTWLPPSALLAALFDPDGVGRMVWSLRLPRLAVGMIAGAAFGVAGLSFQTLLRNPLASPDVIGVTQCAAFGAVLALSLGLPVVAGAWAGGLLAIALLAWLAFHPVAGIETRAVVLQGLALAIFAGAGTETLILRMDDLGAAGLMTWLGGTLGGIGWPEVRLSVWILPLIVPLLLTGRVLDRLELGDDLARSLGLPVGELRAGIGLCAALVASGAVALCGPLGFVALAAGPVARWTARGRPSPVAAAFVGAAFVTLADILARSLAPVALLPTGIYTALIGAPVLILIVRRLARA